MSAPAPHPDYTDVAAEPSLWLDSMELLGVAVAAQLDAEQTSAWLADPDAFLQNVAPNGSPWWDDIALTVALERAWTAKGYTL